MTTLSDETRTIYMTFRGFCTHCGNPTNEGIHEDDKCDMEGAETRLALLGMAFEEFLKVERAIQVIEKVRQYLDWADDENRQELLDAIRWFEKGPSDPSPSGVDDIITAAQRQKGGVSQS